VIEPFALIQSYGYSLGRGQSVHITTKVGSYNITCGIVYSIQLLHDKVCLQVVIPGGSRTIEAKGKLVIPGMFS
jgi:hypothetical protein